MSVKPKGPQPSRKNARPEEDRLKRLNELRARWGKAPLKASQLSIDSCEVEIAREERKLGTALRMRGACAWGLRAASPFCHKHEVADCEDCYLAALT